MTVKYTKDHEWVRLDGDIATVGITNYAQEQLGDVVFVEVPEAGSRFATGAEAAVVESVKAVSDLICPVGGTVVEINANLLDDPELANRDCYGEGWMLVVEISNPTDTEDLMSYATYQEYLEGGAE